jgi:hypothetical protein
MRIYKHLNSGKVDAHPVHSTRARIGSSSDVHDWITRTGQNVTRGTVTATFIVDTEGWLWIADRHSEHVACAAGREILSAGEMTFDIRTQGVCVLDITNQSLGYCPEPDSWPAVASALEQSGIRHPERFTSQFVFRRCSECGTKNIVKDEWYECGVCGASLSHTWNFVDSDAAGVPSDGT